MLGLNQRNAEFILPYNPRHNYPLVDDKRRTKELAIASGISVPELYAVIEIEHQIDELPSLLAPYEEFVVKPAHGSGGEGILVITGKFNGRYRKSTGCLSDEDELGYHISNILSGMYSLGGLPDCALIEHRVDFDPVFEEVSYQGVPDIRTIVFRGIPVQAMVRLPTRASGGRANLHQGAIGVGVDLSSGVTCCGVWRETRVTHHPDTGAQINGLTIPHWEQILALTARCYDLAGLGYIGVDIVLDRNLGPMMLEINARPGLGIQLANRQGLLPRLRYLQAMKTIPESIEERILLAKSLS
jgi:alpha-L-glutamate ligase-like protein